MSAPQIESGRVEQAVHTWSRFTLGGSKGQGFVACSPGLRNSLDWLESIPKRHLRLRDPGMPASSQADKFERLTGVDLALVGGAVQVIVRKLAFAGVDGSGRPRHLFHMLCGRPSELSIAHAPVGAKVWDGPAAADLDEAIRLRSLGLADVPVLDVKHDCGADDGESRRLVLRLLRDGGLESQVSSDELRGALVTGLPSDWWGRLELTTLLGGGGLRTSVLLNDAVARAPQSIVPAALADCQLHQEVQRLGRSVATAKELLDAMDHGAPVPRGSRAAASRAPSGGGRNQPSIRETFENELRQCKGGDGPVTDQQANRIVGVLSGLGSDRHAWLDQLSEDQLHDLLAGVESQPTLGRIRSSLRLAEDLQISTRWRESGAAPLGVLALERTDPSKVPVDLVPSRLEVAQVAHLVGYLRRRSDLNAQLSVLLQSGFGAPPASKLFLKALWAAGVSPRTFYAEVVPSADLEDDDLLELVRLDFDRFAEGAGLPEAYRSALKGAVAASSLAQLFKRLRPTFG